MFHMGYLRHGRTRRNLMTVPYWLIRKISIIGMILTVEITAKGYFTQIPLIAYVIMIAFLVSVLRAKDINLAVRKEN
jgi:hypothetical protein